MGLEEKETHINQSADDRKMWEIFTDDRIRIKEYKQKGLEIKKQVGKGCVFILPDSQLTVRKKSKKLSKEEHSRRTSRLSK
jgi:uncharacterized protein